MSPDTLEKMEKFSFVLELWDQISPSVQEFLGIVKIPLAPIVYSMKTTDNEIYSLNFMADQFCMYPMTISDGFLPVYSPKQGQNIAHLKVSLSMGSPVQVTRLIQKEQEEERRKAQEQERIRIREAEEQKERELKAAKKAKKEKKAKLQEEHKHREEQSALNQDMGLFGMLGGAGSVGQEGYSGAPTPMGGQKKVTIQSSQITSEQAHQSPHHNRNGSNPSEGILRLPTAGSNRPQTPGQIMQENLAALLRQSVNSHISGKDYDQRQITMLDCMRKLFEESRSQAIEELNGEAIFKDEIKNFDGSVQKDEVMYTLLNSDNFSLTRTEVASIVHLMMNINRDDQGKIDIDELHFSYKSYIKYYELIEQRILDMLEKFKLSISKKFEVPDLILEFVSEIEQRSRESKISMIEFREILEDRHGIQIRDALYDQFQLFFDLDRNQQVYTTSFCEYIKSPTQKKVNFFKVNTNVISKQIQDFIKNSIATMPDCIQKLEEDFKEELWKTTKLKLEQQNREYGRDHVELHCPADLLVSEKINAKLFQFKMKRLGIALSLWEVFTLFEHLNMTAKMYFEPQRYHQIMFGCFYTFVKNEEYNRSNIMPPQQNSQESLKKPKEQHKSRNTSQSRTQSQNRSQSKNRSQSREQDKPSQYDIKAHGYNNDALEDEDLADILNSSKDDKGYWHKNDLSDTEDPRRPYKQIKHVFEIRVKELKNIPVLNKFICQSQNLSEGLDAKSQKIAKAQANKYIQNVAVKYSFPLDEDEILESDYLQLNKDALDTQGLYNYQVSMDTVHTYIIGKEDNIKKVLELCQSRGGSQNAPAGDEEDGSQQQRREELFNMSIALYQDNREFIIGNAHLPIEDLIDTIHQYEEKRGTYDRKAKKTSLIRTLFLYGTSYSQRENCIIGKLQLEVVYSQEKLFLSKREAQMYQEQSEKNANNGTNPYSCFMHRETYINRKIPLNAKLAVLIDRVSHLKESIENIEHFAKIQHSAMGLDFEQNESNEDDNEEQFDFYQKTQGLLSQKLSSSSMVHNLRDHQHLDRRRVLKHILKNGLNLIVKCSIFEEDQELLKKFTQDGNNSAGKYQTRMLYNSLNPVFGEVFEMNLQMDTKIFEYLKNKRAVFEIRHYIIESEKQKMAKLRNNDDVNLRDDFDEVASQNTITDEEVFEQCDFIVLGYVRVPLLQLITKNNGVDGDFSIFDEFKQKMGSLRLRITLNHHNSQRPLYSTSSKLPNSVQPTLIQNTKKQTLIDKAVTLGTQIRLGTISRSQMGKNRFILGINFVELILKNKRQLTKHIQGQVPKFYLKYRFMNQNYQTKGISESSTNQGLIDVMLQKINLQRFDISKTTFIDINLENQELVEQNFGKPLEIQLWYKVDSGRSYEKPIHDEMVGQFFVELNELSKVTNRRMRDKNEQRMPGKFHVYEGYFSMHENKRDVLSSDRLGMRIYMFQKDASNETLSIDDLNQLFNQFRPDVEHFIAQKLDPAGKGYTDSDDLIQAVRDHVSDEYLSEKMIWFIRQSLEYKSVDKVYYSPLFGLPPPFFRYAKKFDQQEIICKFNEELEALDSQDNGFIPVNVFRNVLEGELKVKTKIVEDFVNGLRDIEIENSNTLSNTKVVKDVQSLDVNLVTNSLKTSHVDYIILLRKLSMFIEKMTAQTNTGDIRKSATAEAPQEEVIMHFEIDNGMRVKNPLNSNETPNSYVYMKPDFICNEVGQFIQTNEIRNNSYPSWNFRSQSFTIPLNAQNKEFFERGSLQFEVFHKSYGQNESTHLIGVAFVPLRPLIEGSGKTVVSGMYDIVSKNSLYSHMSSLQKYEASYGKIKIQISTNVNIKNFVDGNYERNDSFGVHQSIASSFEKKIQTFNDNISVMSSQNFQKLNQSMQQYDDNLQAVSDQKLDELHKFNMQELDNLTKKLQESMKVGGDASPKQVDFARATFKTDVQKMNLTEQLQEFQQKRVENPFASSDTLGQVVSGFANDEMEEVQEEEFQSETATAQQIVQHEINDKRIELASPRSLDKKEDEGSPTFAEENPLNVFNDRANPAEEETFDIEELKRIERILQKK